MFKRFFKDLKNRYRKIRVLLSPHPLFRRVDKFKLSKIKRETNKKGFVILKPKGWAHTIKIRKNYTDREVVHYVLQDQYHLPPSSLAIAHGPTILDLGSNIGLTIAHMKQIYPNAKIIGYEMNTENYNLAVRNTKFYSNVSVNNKAVWIEDTLVSYKNDSGNDAYSITQGQSAGNESDVIEVESITLDSIIKQHNIKQIDYIKMDIEGAEESILSSGDIGWMSIVKMMNIEMHLDDENDIDKYITILKNNGFDAWKDTKHWSSIFAIRKVSVLS